jgi:thiamine-phosphate pyrophosphorylase
VTRLDPARLRLYLVTDAELCGATGVVETVRRAVSAGVTMVQLRDPAATDDDFVTTGRQLRGVLDRTGVPLIVNDRVHLVDAIGADGAHVGQNDLDIRSARTLLGSERLLGLSASTAAELSAAAGVGEDVLDYVGGGAFRATATKSDHPAPDGLALVDRLREHSRWPFVIIGGVGVADLPVIRRGGAAGVAVVSAICGQPDIDGATGALRAAWDGGK